jgi:hypothetical protein
VTAYALVTFHVERECTVQQVIGPRLKSLKRDNFFGELRSTTLLTNSPTSTPLDVIAKIHDIHALIIEQLQLADVYQTTYHKRRTKQFEFAENDLIWLSTANLLLSTLQKTSPTLHWPVCYNNENFITCLPPAPRPCNAIICFTFPD